MTPSEWLSNVTECAFANNLSQKDPGTVAQRRFRTLWTFRCHQRESTGPEEQFTIGCFWPSVDEALVRHGFKHYCPLLQLPCSS